MEDSEGHFAVGRLELIYVVPPDGEPYISLSEDGNLDTATQLGMLEMAKDTLLHPEWDEEEPTNGI